MKMDIVMARQMFGRNLRAFYTVPAELPDDIRALLTELGAEMPDQSDRDRAFGAALIEVVPRLRAFARKLSRNPDTAEDLVQETLLRSWSARDRFVVGTNMVAWTSTILRHHFLTLYHRNRRWGDYDEGAAERRLATSGDQDVALELNQVRDRMARLSPSLRDALTMVAVDGLSYEEASRRLGITLAALKSRVNRARMALQALLEAGAPPVRSAEQAAAADHRRRPSTATPPRRSLPKRQAAQSRSAWAIAKAEGRSLIIG